ncbi:hypothetical protein F2Q70_00028364 [Brassica cretica]|uniref:Uncharacterized protein n=1 Tax=Brassica cretica TaxID=69181 RepID=A0A8S9LBZ4_BRACR|nr:hypothetical protein F2Q70_00028364 [Brassica cretica]
MAATKMVCFSSQGSHLPLIKRFFRYGFGYAVFQIWKTSGLEYFQTTSRKSSNGVFSHVFNEMVLIFHLDISGSDFGRPMGSLLESLLKYNALKDFQEVFQTTSKKSSRKSSDGVFFHIK